MGRYSLNDSLTPGQRRARTRAVAINSAMTKFKHEQNTHPQFFDGAITECFSFANGKILFRFEQYGQPYQVIIGPDHGDVFKVASILLPLFKNKTRFHITVKARRGSVNEKGFCNLYQVTYIR